MTNGLSNPRNHASSSSASTKAEKRKEYQKRYYAARKENNKVSKFGSGDAPQSASSISLMNNRSTERTPLRSLQTNITQFTQTTNENASSVSTIKRKEYNKGCSNTRNDNGMRISNGSQVNQTPIDDVIDVVRHRTSRGFYLFNKDFFFELDIFYNLHYLIHQFFRYSNSSAYFITPIC